MTTAKRTMPSEEQKEEASTDIPGGIAHELPNDLRKALSESPEALAAWRDISQIARNEWICWVITAKGEETRANHVKRTVTELTEGMRRPCCWFGCVHRTDKKLSATQQFILNHGRAQKSKSTNNQPKSQL